MINGVMSSIIIFFFLTNTTLYQAFRKDGQVVDFEVFGVTLYTSVVWTANCQMALAINYFTWIQHFFIWGSIASWYVFVIIYGSLPPTVSTTAYKVFVEACAPSPLCWLVTFFVVISALLPYLGYRAFQTRFQPMYHDLIQQNLIENQNQNQTDDAGESGLSPPRGKMLQLIERLKQGES